MVVRTFAVGQRGCSFGEPKVSLVYTAVFPITFSSPPDEV